MASLTHHRLGAPAATGFAVWARTDAAATVAVETRLPGETAWTAQDSSAVDTAQDNTAVLSVAGLNPATKYEYRVLVDSVEATSNSTFTMPTSGRFVVYHHSDEHNNEDSAPRFWATMSAWILNDWQTNYEPLGIPAFVICTGDWYINGGADTQTDVFNHVLQAVGDGAALHARLPMLFCVGDWDFAGNNSSKDNIATASSLSEHIAVLQWAWRDMARPASPTLATHVEIAGVPFILLDERTERANQFARTPRHHGDEDLTVADAFGTAQRDWLIARLVEYAGRGLVVLCNHSVPRTQIAAQGPAIGSARDSLGIFYKREIDNIARTALSLGYAGRLVWWIGDDHRNTVFRGYSAVDILPNTAFPSVTEDPLVLAPLPISMPMFMCVSQDSAGVGGSVGKFGYGEYGHWGGSNHDCVVRWDITAIGAGQDVEARATYFHVTGAQADPGAGGTPTSDNGDSAGLPMDFYYRNGWLTHYDANLEKSAQKYPPDNSPLAKPVFGKAYVDQIIGTMHTRADIYRDEDGLLRRIEDIDEPDRDELAVEYPPRSREPLEPI